MLGDQAEAPEGILVDLALGPERVTGHVPDGIERVLTNGVVSVKERELRVVSRAPGVLQRAPHPQGLDFAVGEGVEAAVFFPVKAGAVEAAGLVGVVVDEAGGGDELAPVAEQVVGAEGEGQFLKVAVADGAVPLLRIVAAHVHAEFAEGLGGAEVGAPVAEVAGFGLHPRREHLRGRLCDKIDGPADGLAAVEGGGGPPDHLNRFKGRHVDLDQGIVVEVAGGADRDAVFQVQKQALVADRLPDRHRVLLVAEVYHVHPAHLVEQLVQRHGLGVGDDLLGEHADGHGRLRAGLLLPVCRHHHLVELAGCRVQLDEQGGDFHRHFAGGIAEVGDY